MGEMKSPQRRPLFASNVARICIDFGGHHTLEVYFVRGHPVRYWFKLSGVRNEALDRRVYARASLHARSLGKFLCEPRRRSRRLWGWPYQFHHWPRLLP